MANQTKVYFHGFAYKPPEPSKLDEKFLVVPKPVLVEGTGDTKVSEDDKVDLYELIQSYRDQCGVEFMLKQIKLGMVNPATLADDGNHSGDASILPDNPADAYQASLVAYQKKLELAKALGIPADQLTEENIAAKIAEIYGRVDGQTKTEEVKKDE